MSECDCYEACRRLVPGWQNADVTIEQLQGGLSNQLFLVEIADPGTIDIGAPTRCIMRLFCMSGDLIDRTYEQRVFAFLAESGFGPILYGTDGVWRAEQYLPGSSLHVEQLSQIQHLSQVANLLARFHSLTPPLTVAPDRTRTVLDLVDKWIQVALQLCPDSDGLGDRLGRAKQDLDRNLRPMLERLSCPIVFCHNDAQEGNVLRHEADHTYVLIDYEYAGWNYRGYDLANVVCECVIDNNAPHQPDGFEIRPDLEPDHTCLERMATAYLTQYYGTSPISTQIMDLIQEIRMFQPVSHLLWAAWAATKTWSSTAIAFGYRQYGEARLDLFQRDMDRLM